MKIQKRPAGRFSTAKDMLLSAGTSLVLCIFVTLQNPAMAKGPEFQTDAAREISVAASIGDLQRVKTLFQLNPNLPKGDLELLGGVLRSAAQHGDGGMAGVLLSNKVDVNSSEVGGTALHYACWWGQKDIVEMLLAHDANVNAKNSTGYTPLHAAAEYGRKEIGTHLIAKGANVNAEASGVTPLLLARRYGHKELAALLERHGAREQP